MLASNNYLFLKLPLLEVRKCSQNYFFYKLAAAQ